LRLIGSFVFLETDQDSGTDCLKSLISWWTWSGSNRRPLPCHRPSISILQWEPASPVRSTQPDASTLIPEIHPIFSFRKARSRACGFWRSPPYAFQHRLTERQSSLRCPVLRPGRNTPPPRRAPLQINRRRLDAGRFHSFDGIPRSTGGRTARVRIVRMQRGPRRTSGLSKETIEAS
jgi:hypothetical protein